MNIRRMAVLSAVLFALSPLHPAFAVADKVVMPDEDSNSSDESLPDLSGNPVSKNTKTAPAQIVRTAPITQNGSLYDTTPVTSITAVPSVNPAVPAPETLPYTPAPAPAAIAPPVIRPGAPTVVTGGPGVFTIKFPTSVIQMPEPVELPDSGTKPTRSVSIDLGEKTWTESDIQQVSTHLGLDKDKVTSSCYITATGNLMTEQTPHTINTGTSLHTDVGYDGSIRNVVAAIQALCKIDTLAPNLGFIRAVGTRYTADLGTVYCAPTTSPNPKQIVLDRGGAGVMGKCEFK